MKLFTQLALVSAIAVSGNAMAMQALDDTQLASTTGQDGITLTIKPPVKPFTPVGGATANMGVIDIDHIYVHDKGGLANADGGTDTSGAITLDGFAIAGNAPIVVKIDADGNAGDAFLNVNVALPSELIIRTGDIGVAQSNRVAGDAATVKGIVAGSQNQVLDSIDLKLGGATLNIQLGSEVQAGNVNATTMIKAGGTITNGLSISGLTLRDSAGVAPGAGQLGTTGGAIYIGEILVTDNLSNNLTIATDIDVSASGLVLTVGGTASDVMLADVRLGTINKIAGVIDNATSAASLGDVEIVGLDMVGAQIAVSGH